MIQNFHNYSMNLTVASTICHFIEKNKQIVGTDVFQEEKKRLLNRLDKIEKVQFPGGVNFYFKEIFNDDMSKLYQIIDEYNEYGLMPLILYADLELASTKSNKLIQIQPAQWVGNRDITHNQTGSQRIELYKEFFTQKSAPLFINCNISEGDINKMNSELKKCKGSFGFELFLVALHVGTPRQKNKVEKIYQQIVGQKDLFSTIYVAWIN